MDATSAPPGNVLPASGSSAGNAFPFRRPLRPGISDEMLKRTGVRKVSDAEAKELCGLSEAGLFIPYRTFGGEPVVDAGKPYGRLRLDAPKDSKKYHQAFGSAVHAYLPPGSDTARSGGDLTCIEGEFKAMALTEAGFPTVGISGFFGFAIKGGEALVPEVAEVIEAIQPTRILFVGDSDTVLNLQFSTAAIRLATLVAPIPVLLPRIPLNAPGKGADDCRDALKDRFNDWWRERIASAVPVEAGADPFLLAIELFEREREALASLRGSVRHTSDRRFVKFAASLDSQPLLQEQVLAFAEKRLGMRRRGLSKAVAAAVKERKNGLQADDDKSEPKGRLIALDEPAAVWTRQIWEVVADETFMHAGQVCRFEDGLLQPQSAASLVSYLDHRDRCRFVLADRNGNEMKSKFGEGDARIFLGSWLDSRDIIRTIDVVSKVPVLAWNGSGPVLVNEYDRNLRILAGGPPLELPEPAEAVKRIIELLRDYDFVTQGDFGRAIALLLSPALAQGGFLGSGRVPLFLVEKNAVSTGGSLLLRLTCFTYGLKPRPITKVDNPERTMEDISKALLSGEGFIYFDNTRGGGLQHLPELESLLTEPVFTCRAPYRHGEADVTRRVLAVSSNGAVFSRDLASRTVKIAIRKRPLGHQFFEWPEGSIEDHVKENYRRYLAAAFSLVNDWALAGRPAGKDLTGFRFTQWERACAWILQKHFPGLPLLDAAHDEEQNRLADPDHDLLRNLFRVVIQGETRGELSASSLAEIGSEAGLLDGTEQQNRLKIGKAMKRRCPCDGQHSFDSGRFVIFRETRKSTTGNGHDVSFYEIRAEGQNE